MYIIVKKCVKINIKHRTIIETDRRPSGNGTGVMTGGYTDS